MLIDTTAKDLLVEIGHLLKYIKINRNEYTDDIYRSSPILTSIIEYKSLFDAIVVNMISTGTDPSSSHLFPVMIQNLYQLLSVGSDTFKIEDMYLAVDALGDHELSHDLNRLLHLITSLRDHLKCALSISPTTHLQ